VKVTPRGADPIRLKPKIAAPKTFPAVPRVHPLHKSRLRRLNAFMPELTGRPDPHRSDSWHVYYGDIHVGTIARAVALRNASRNQGA
jgi:hypothetical protein